MDPVEIRRRNLIADDAYPCASPSGLRFEQLSHHAALNKLMTMMDYDALRAEQAALRNEEHSSRHRHCQLHRGHQSQRGVLRRRRRQDIVAGRRRGAAGRTGLGDLPDQHHRAGAGLGIAHRADRRQRARRLDGARPRHSRAIPTTRPMAAAPGPRAAPASAARPRFRRRRSCARTFSMSRPPSCSPRRPNSTSSTMRS